MLKIALKKEIKDSEARILVYLSQVPKPRKSVELISQKLGIDYIYTIRILKEMVLKNWLFKHKLGRHMFYDLTTDAPVDKARNALCPDELQKIIDTSEQLQLTEEEKQILNASKEE